MPRDYDPQGTAITDEAVACDTSVTINATTYYKGLLAEVPGQSLLGISDPDYGVWTAASKGGTRFEIVQFPVVPAESDPGSASPPDLAVDLAAGVLYSTDNRSVYVRYVGHGSPIRAADLGGGAASSYDIKLPTIEGMLDDGDERDHLRLKWHSNLRITKAMIVAPVTGGMSATLTLRLRNYISSDTPDQSRDIAMSAGTDNTGWLTLSSPIEITTSQDLVINGDGKNAQNLSIYLLHEAA